MTIFRKAIFIATSSLVFASSVVAESDASILARARADADVRSVQSGGAPSSFEDNEPDRAQYDWSRADVSQFVSVECFYAWAKDDVVDHSDLKCDVYGVELRYGVTASVSVFDFDFFVAGRVGYGSDDVSYKYDDGTRDKTEVETTIVQLVVGFDAHYKLDDSFSVFLGGQVGAGLAHTKIDLDYSDDEGDDDSDSDVGLVFGVGVGCVFSPSEHHGIIIRADIITSLAQPEVFEVETDTQTHVMLSIGYKYSF